MTTLGRLPFGRRKRARVMAPPRRVPTNIIAQVIQKFDERLKPEVEQMHPAVGRRFYQISMEALLSQMFGYAGVPWSYARPRIRSMYSRITVKALPKRQRMMPSRVIKPEGMMPFGPLKSIVVKRYRFRSFTPKVSALGLSGLGQAKGEFIIPPPPLEPPEFEPPEFEPPEFEPPEFEPSGPPVPIDLIGLPIPAQPPGTVAMNIVVESDPSGRTISEVTYKVGTDADFRESLVASGVSPTGTFRVEGPLRPYHVFLSAPGHEATVALVDLPSFEGGAASGVSGVTGLTGASISPLAGVGTHISYHQYMRGVGSFMSSNTLGSLEQAPTIPEYTIRIRMRKSEPIPEMPPFAVEPSAFPPITPVIDTGVTPVLPVEPPKIPLTPAALPPLAEEKPAKMFEGRSGSSGIVTFVRPVQTLVKGRHEVSVRHPDYHTVTLPSVGAGTTTVQLILVATPPIRGMAALDQISPEPTKSSSISQISINVIDKTTGSAIRDARVVLSYYAPKKIDTIKLPILGEVSKTTVMIGAGMVALGMIFLLKGK